MINDDLERNHKVKIENVVVNFSEETISSLILLHSRNYQKDALDVEISSDIFTKARTSLIKTFSNFSLLIASQAKLKYENEENFREFFNSFELVFKNSKNLNTFLKNKLTIDSALTFKCVVYTFDNIALRLNLDIDPKTFKEIKIGIHKSEKSLNHAINDYLKSEIENLLIIRLEWSQHAQHLQLIKFLIEKLKLDYQKK